MSNAGQIDPLVLYYSSGPGYGVYFTQEAAVFTFVRQIPRETGPLHRSVATAGTEQSTQGIALALRFLGANPKAEIAGNRQSTARVNYLVGSDPAKWRTGIPTYEEIVYRELWPGIDLIFRQANGQFKYEFVLQPGARPAAIRLAYRGAEGLALDAAGNLLIKTALGVLTDERPKSYQVIGGTQVPVESRFTLDPDGQDPKAYGFAAGVGYDPRYSLVIDPGLGYSTLLGGSGTDIAHAIAVDGSGGAFIAGQTDSADFPTFPTPPTCQTPTTTTIYDTCFGSGTKVHGFTDAFVAKFAPGGVLEWATFLGGSDADVAFGIARDATGVYVTGYTYSSDFPTTGAFSAKISGNSDAFVTKLTLDGKGLLYSTFLGGGGLDAGHAIAVDGAGNAYVAGETLSSNFPITPFAVFAKSQGKRDAFVTKLDTTKTGLASLVYSTYLGGNGDDIGFGIAAACDPANPGQCDAVVTGQTASPNFPTVLNYPSIVGASINTALSGPSDAFVAKLSADGFRLVYSTFLGGSQDDAGYAVAVDSAANAYVTGSTTLSNGLSAALVTKLNPAGTAPVVFSTSLGGSASDQGLGIALACPDPKDPTKCSAVVTGQTTSTSFPITPGAFQTALNGTGTGPSSDAFVTKLKPDGSGLSYSTYLGGGGADAGNGIAFTCTTPPASGCSAYVTGQTNSPAFPTPTTGAVLHANNTDAFVAKVDIGATTTTAVTSSASPSLFGQSVTLTATVTSAVGTPTGTVIFDDGTTQLATKTLDASGRATLTTTSLSVDSHTITAFYSGDSNFLASTSPTFSQTVSKSATTTTLTVTPSLPVFGQSVAFTATVAPTPPGGGTPTGTVTFLDAGAQLGTGPLPLSGGQATLTTAGLAVGTHSISVTYGGDANFTGSTGPPSGPLSQTVGPASTTTTLASSGTSTTFGQSVTFTATVRSTVSTAAGTPTGTVTFMNYGASLGTSALTSSGQATLTTNALRIGFNSITASYNGSTNFLSSTSAASSSGILSQPVISAPTVLGTDRTAQQPAGALYLNCKAQFVTVTGIGFLAPTAFPPNIGVSLTPSAGITVVGLSFISPTTLSVQVDVDPGASGSRSITVTNPDTGTGTSAGPILDVGNPNPCPAQGLAPKTTSSGTATPPAISSLVPSSGLRGSSVTVNGSNFGSAPVVTFTGPGNTPVIATINSSTSTSLTVTTPAFPTNTADAFDGPVFVTNGGLASNGVVFTVTNPRLSVVTPSSAPPGSATLNLAGTKLLGGATVQFFNTGTTTPASGVTVTSVTSDGTGQHLTVGLTASAVTGLLDVVVTNSGGGSSRLAGAFQVKAAPAAGFRFSVADSANPSSTDPSAFLPSVDSVQVTLDSTGKCTAKSITPHAVTLTANFTTTVGAPPPSSVTFTITSVSNLPGTATNEDCELGATPTSDFSIGVASVTSQQVTVSGSGTYQTTLYSYDMGGNVTVTVTGLTTVNGVPNQTVTAPLSLPVDTDGDKLPDAYELDATLNTNAAGQNALDWLNRDQNGNGIVDGDDRFAADGLNNFEKYRGVYRSGPVPGGTGPLTGFARLGAGLRHLFVRGRGFGNDPAIQAAPGTCGITVGPLGPTDPGTGTPVSDPTLSASNPCPFFLVGPAFFAAGVQVHDVSASFTASATFPRQSLVSPSNPTLDMATIMYDGVNCGSAAGCSTSKTGARNWTFSPLGVSSYGTSTAYGPDSRVLKKAVDAYFTDRPYQRRTAGLSPCTASSTTPCYVTSNGTSTGTPMLTPQSLVGDLSNDDGVKDTSQEVVDAGGNLIGDTYIAGSFNQQLSAMAALNDGCVQLPFVADPRGIPTCNPAASSALSPQSTKQQAVRSLITHELGHNVGINTHTTDATDIMYQYTTNWIRDGHFSPTATGLIQIHNKGLQ